MTYSIKQVPPNEAIYTPHGGAAEFMYCHDTEVIIHSGAETGKTLAACWLLHLTASKYDGAQMAIVRKTQKSVYGSVLQTFERVIKGSPVVPYGGEKPEKYIYPNGSMIWVGGLDNSDKVLSSERDIIYVNQAEETLLDDWEKLLTRCTGRNAVIPFPRLIGDANPAGSKHWIVTRPSLTLIQGYHTDNPTLYDADGNLTEQGRRTFARLDSLSGVRYKRLRQGLWVTAEGTVYDMFDASIHVKERLASEFKTWYLAIDEGYTNPAVILLVGEDSDGRWHVVKEFYERGKLPSEVVRITREWTIEYGVRLVAVDAQAAGLIADLRNNGVSAVGGKGRVLDGIGDVQDRFKVQGDGLPRLTIDPSCANSINDFESYVWKVGASGAAKDEVLKENDHAPDAIRYLQDVVGKAPGGFSDNPFGDYRG